MANTRFERGGWHRKDLLAYVQQQVDAQPDPAYEALRANLTRALREEVTPRQREVLALYYQERLNTRQIADRLGIDRSTVSRSLKRGEERLRRCLRYTRGDLLSQGSRTRPRNGH